MHHTKKVWYYTGRGQDRKVSIMFALALISLFDCFLTAVDDSDRIWGKIERQSWTCE
jgi:hypothetical protein